MEYIKLSEICDLQNGYAFKSSDYVNYSNTINCRMSNIRPGAIFDLNYSPKYLPDDFAEKYSDYLLNDEDIVIAMTDLAGDPKILGVPAQVKTNGKNVLLNQRVGRLILKNKDIDFRYLKYNLSNPKNKEYYKRFSGGGLQINISKKDILNLEIPLHEKKEQLQIADKLDNIQKIINIRKEEIEKCNKLIKSQFVEMFGTPLVNERNYKVENADKICLKITDGSHYSPMNQGMGYPMLSVKDMRNDGFHYDSCKYISIDDYNKMQKLDCIPKKNDVLIAKDGSYFYYGFVVEEEKEEAILSSIAMLRPDTKIVNPFYLRYYMMSSEIVDLVSKNYVTGAALKRVILKGIKQIPVMIPNIDEQNKFEKIVKQIDKQKFEFEKSLKKLEELQASLMQEYFG